MKVISTVPHHSVVKQVVCHKCGSTLEYTPNDVTDDRRTDYTGCTDTYKIINCGNCGNKITVS